MAVWALPVLREIIGEFSTGDDMVLGFQCLVWSCEVTSLGFIVIITTITIISITKAEIRVTLSQETLRQPCIKRLSQVL